MMRRLMAAFSLLIAISMPASADGGLIFSVEIPMTVGAEVTARTPDGKAVPLGHVLRLPVTTRWPAYTASKWGPSGTVSATAVNAIHLLVGVQDGKGRTMSLVPAKTIAPAATPGSDTVLDMAAGSGIFGAWSPVVGSKVTVVKPDGATAPLSALPESGDVLRIDVEKQDVPYLVDIENRPGGRVYSWTEKHGASVIARVIRPVRGVGRFEGTKFQDIGRIRANHPGVIDISTSKEGEIGGFQILPYDHSQSAEMGGAWNLTQWLVIGPPDGKSAMVGRPPLFQGALLPGPAEGEALWDVWSTYGRRPLVLARIDGGPWVKLPEAAGKQDKALANVTHLRIYFPHTEEPLKAF